MAPPAVPCVVSGPEALAGFRQGLTGAYIFTLLDQSAGRGLISLAVGVGKSDLLVKTITHSRVVDRRHEDGANAPDIQALLDRFGVAGFPAIVIIDLNGPAALRQTGFKSREATFSFLRDAPARLEAAKKRTRSAR